MILITNLFGCSLWECLFYYGMDKVHGAACEPETYLCIELAGVDLLVLCTDRFGVHDSSFY